MKKIHRITSATRPNRNATGTPPEDQQQQINNSSLGVNSVNNSSLSVPLPLPLPLTSVVEQPPRPYNISVAEPQQPLALTKDMIPDRLSKDSDASQN